MLTAYFFSLLDCLQFLLLSLLRIVLIYRPLSINESFLVRAPLPFVHCLHSVVYFLNFALPA